jgi:putative ABC transport system permease protein
MGTAASPQTGCSNAPMRSPAFAWILIESAMTFFSLVFRNLFRQRMRTALTIVGISVGITIVVALGAITGGARQTVGGWLHVGGADFVVARKGSADFSFSTVSEKEWAKVAAVDGVERATGVLMRVTRHGSPWSATRR